MQEERRKAEVESKKAESPSRQSRPAAPKSREEQTVVLNPLITTALKPEDQEKNLRVSQKDCT